LQLVHRDEELLRNVKKILLKLNGIIQWLIQEPQGIFPAQRTTQYQTGQVRSPLVISKLIWQIIVLEEFCEYRLTVLSSIILIINRFLQIFQRSLLVINHIVQGPNGFH